TNGRPDLGPTGPVLRGESARHWQNRQHERRRSLMDIPQERKLVTEIPGPASKELLARRETAVPRGVFNTTPIFTQRAAGAIIEDIDGNRLIDLSTGIAVLNVGNTSPAVVKAVQEQ